MAELGHMVFHFLLALSFELLTDDHVAVTQISLLSPVDIGGECSLVEQNK